MAVWLQDLLFADAHLVLLQRHQSICDLYSLIEDFRQHIQHSQFEHPGKGESHSAFATDANCTPTFRGQLAPGTKPTCICGDKHWFSDCYYLVPEKRHKGWNPRSDTQQKVNSKLADPKIKAKIDRALQRNKNRQNRSGGTPANVPSGSAISGGASANTLSTVVPSSSTTPTLSARVTGSFTVQASSFVTLAYHLQCSWILDNGSDSHVCNNSMLSRFTKTHDPHPDDMLAAGTQIIPIESWGTLDITIQTPSTGPHLMNLCKVAYVPGFMTNLVSQDKLYVKRLYFDN